MFGIGIGEIIVILLIVFIVAPKDIPRMVRVIGRALHGLEKLRGEVADIGKEVSAIADEPQKGKRQKKQPVRSKAKKRKSREKYK